MKERLYLPEISSYVTNNRERSSTASNPSLLCIHRCLILCSEEMAASYRKKACSKAYDQEKLPPLSNKTSLVGERCNTGQADTRPGASSLRHKKTNSKSISSSGTEVASAIKCGETYKQLTQKHRQARLKHKHGI